MNCPFCNDTGLFPAVDIISFQDYSTEDDEQAYKEIVLRVRVSKCPHCNNHK